LAYVDLAAFVVYDVDAAATFILINVRSSAVAYLEAQRDQTLPEDLLPGLSQ
jgi:hypothetical protein